MMQAWQLAEQIRCRRIFAQHGAMLTIWLYLEIDIMHVRGCADQQARVYAKNDCINYTCLSRHSSSSADALEEIFQPPDALPHDRSQ
jgi:hypothetical protein